MKRLRFANTVVVSVALWALAGAGVAAAQNTPDIPPKQAPQQPAQTIPATPADDAAPSLRATNGAAMNTARSLAGADQHFLEEVSHGNNAEIRLAQLALQKSNDAEVKRVAQMIIRDHQKAQQEVQQIAQANNVTLPNEPNPIQQATYMKLSKLSGAAFDKKYVAGQIQDHVMDVNLFTSITEVGNNVEVKQFAKKTIPALAQHAEGLRKVARRIGVPAALGRPMESELARGAGMMKSASSSRAPIKNPANVGKTTP